MARNLLVKIMQEINCMHTGIQDGHFAFSSRKRSWWVKVGQVMKRVDFPAIWDPLGLFFVKWGLSVQFPIKLNGKQLNYESSDLVRPTPNFSGGSKRYQSMRNGAVVQKIPAAPLNFSFLVSYQRKRSKRGVSMQFLLIVRLVYSLYGWILSTFF